MENSTFTNLSTLQKLITFNNVESLKESFIKETFRKYEAPLNFNTELGILEYYDAYKDEIIALNFENYLKEILWKETQSCKEAIDSSLIILDSIQRRKFIEYIKTTIKYIENSQIELILKFPICKKPFEEITAYLKEKHQINLANDKNLNNVESLFKVKAGIKTSLFKDLYDITIKYEIIDDELISEEIFISVLLDRDTSHKMVFNCKSGLTMMYLQTISALFDNLKGKSIENSYRFQTKASKPISETNYNKAKKSISAEDKATLTNFKTDFKRLLS